MKVLKDIKINQKLSIDNQYILNVDNLPHYLNFEYLLKVKRRISGQSRHKIINFINNLVDISEKKIEKLELSDIRLKEITVGLKNLRETYNDDDIIKNNINIIINRINSR